MTLTRNNIQSQTIRNSGVELLKVFAILAICLSHCTQTMEQFVDFQEPTYNIQLLILRLFRFGGSIGNLVFMISSSYFLFGKKVRREKAINLLFDSQLISVIILIAFCIFGTALSSDISLLANLFSRNLFPDLYENVWFVPNYVALYLTHPALDKIINGLSQKRHLALCIFFFAFYGLCGLLNTAPCLSYFFNFILIYFFVAYMKIYSKSFMSNKKKNIIIFIVSFVLLIITILIKNCLGFYITVFEYFPNLNNTISPILFPMMISLFNIFLNFDFKNKAINYLSSCSLFVYCIHENLLIREELRPKFYELMIYKSGGINHCLLNVLLLFAIIVVVSFTAAIIYKHTLHKLTAKLSVKADRFICNNLNKTTTKLMKENNNEK